MCLLYDAPTPLSSPIPRKGTNGMVVDDEDDGPPMVGVVGAVDDDVVVVVAVFTIGFSFSTLPPSPLSSSSSSLLSFGSSHV